MASVIYPKGWHDIDGFPLGDNQVKKELNTSNGKKAHKECGRIIAKGNRFDGTRAIE